MLRIALILSFLGMFAAAPSGADVVVFVDGTQMEVQRYEEKGGLVVLTLPSGQLRSVPRTYVDLEATRRANQTVAGSGPSAPGKTPRAEPPVASPRQEAPSPQEGRPREEARPAEAQAAPPPQPTADVAPAAPSSPPPVWADEELNVSLVVPSAAWTVETKGSSFDVAVRLNRPATDAWATLALVRQRIRDYKDFQKIVGDIENSIAVQPGYRTLGTGPLMLDPYTAHEIRYLKQVQGRGFFSRIVVFYSRDLAYVLSMSCPEETVERNEADFEALVRGLVIKKVRKDITPKGAPRG